MTQLINPFAIHTDPMERLLLINFEKDPDSVYVGFEPQVFDDEVNGKGHLIIGWRKDGRVDVYHQAGLSLSHAKYDIVGKGLANMVAADMEPAFFEIGYCGVHAHYAFHDISNRQVEILIMEKNTSRRKPFGLVAPMGDAAERPHALPLVFLHDFYFVRKRKTKAMVSIDGRLHKLDELPLPMDWMSMYFMRYSPRPLIATFNPAFDGILAPVEIQEGKGQYSEDNSVIELTWDNQQPCISSFTQKNEIYPVCLSFQPAFPSLSGVKEGEVIKGNFTISAHASTGTITGEYEVQKQATEKLTISLVPSGGWQPNITKFSLRIIYGLAKVFKRWPTTYRWTAFLHKMDDGSWYMKSGWERTGRIMKGKQDEKKHKPSKGTVS